MGIEPWHELAELMGDISEECWCAGWLDGTEHSLWEIVNGASPRWGMGEVSPAEIARLRELSEKLSGWVYWRESDIPDQVGECFVPMGVWREMHARRMARP